VLSPEGALLTVDWQSKPVWVVHRSVAQIARLAVNKSELSNRHLNL
jgi:hypothetical protein